MGRFSQTLVSFLPLFPLSSLCSELSCSYACQTSLDVFQFNDTDPAADYYIVECTTLLKVQSIFLCMRKYCDALEIETGLKDFNHSCQEYGLVSLLPFSVIEDITEEDAQKLQSVDLTDYEHAGDASAPPVPFAAPILVTSNLFYDAYRTTTAFERSEVTRALYGYAMYGFWGVVLLIGISHRLLSHIISSHQRFQSKKPKGKMSTIPRCRLFMKQYVTTPAFFSHHAAEQVGWCTIPPRLESLTIIVFIIINLVLNCVSFEVFSGNLYWTTSEGQIWRYVSDRTAVLSLAKLPLVFAFGIRNNFFLWLTGWSFSTYNQFHRWIARIATLEAIVHSIAWTVPELEAGKAVLYADWKERYWYMGGLATVTMSFILLFSAYPLRKKLYELFLIMHIVLVIAFLVGMWYHLEIWDGFYNGYMYPCFAVWGFDRLVRIVRLAALNFRSSRAIATYNPSSDIIRLKIPITNSKGFRPRPGAYYYIYAMNGIKFWESHPFTLGGWEQDETGSSLSFFIRPYNSFTARLRNSITTGKSSEDGISLSTRNIRIAVEGPYGSCHHLKNYDSVLFLVGGSGVSIALGELCDLKNKVSRARIQLVWAVRDIALFEDVFNHELRPWLNSSAPDEKLHIQIDVYITRTSLDGSTELRITPTMQDKYIIHDKEHEITHVRTAEDLPPPAATARGPSLAAEITALEANSKESCLPSPPTPSSPSSSTPPSSIYNNAKVRINFSYGRPDLYQIVDEVASREAGKKLAVVSCGPAAMADDARAAAVKAIGKAKEHGGGALDYVNESFNW